MASKLMMELANFLIVVETESGGFDGLDGSRCKSICSLLLLPKPPCIPDVDCDVGF